MEIAEKVKMLKAMDTKELINKLHQYENELEKVMKEQASFSAQSHGFIASRGSDCSEVKRILAELTPQAPEANESTGKKSTVADRENWLMLQRKENKELSDTIVKQREVAFLLDDYQIKLEMTKKRLEGIRGVMALKTAQINFLASG